MICMRSVPDRTSLRLTGSSPSNQLRVIAGPRCLALIVFRVRQVSRAKHLFFVAGIGWLSRYFGCENSQPNIRKSCQRPLPARPKTQDHRGSFLREDPARVWYAPGLIRLSAVPKKALQKVFPRRARLYSTLLRFDWSSYPQGPVFVQQFSARLMWMTAREFQIGAKSDKADQVYLDHWFVILPSFF